MPTASTQVSFEELKTFFDGLYTTRQTWPGPGEKAYVNFMERMMDFKDVVAIEAKRRKIEQLQNQLEGASRATFARTLPVAGGRAIDLVNEVEDAAQGVLREAHCKWIVVKILRLLDDCEHMGVDIQPSKKVLLDFLEEMKPKVPADA